MALTLKKSSEAYDSFVDKVFEIEKLTYSEELCGTLENQRTRYNFEKDSFLLVYDGDVLAGYINFLTISDKLFSELSDKNRREMRDDDIMPSEMDNWRCDKENNIFIISVVVTEKYRDGEAIKLIGNGFLEYLRNKEADGYIIGNLSGSAVSGGGENFLRRFRADFYKELDGGYKYYLADRKKIKELIKNGLLLKNVRG